MLLGLHLLRKVESITLRYAGSHTFATVGDKPSPAGLCFWGVQVSGDPHLTRQLNRGSMEPGAPARLGGPGCPDMPARRPGNALGDKGASIDTGRHPGTGQGAVAAPFPRLPDASQFLGAALATERPNLRPHAVAPDRAFGPGEVGMVVALIAGWVRRMDGEIDGTAMPIGQRISEVTDQGEPLGVGQFVGKRGDGGPACHSPAAQFAAPWPALSHTFGVEGCGPQSIPSADHHVAADTTRPGDALGHQAGGLAGSEGVPV